MLAASKIPPQFVAWNQNHGAPHGRIPPIPWWKRKFISRDEVDRLRGPFAIQENNTTREFEYPWAFEAGQLSRGNRVLEIGGGLSGFQFVLSQMGCDVINVDPGMDAEGVGWPCDETSMRKLNERFGTNVKLQNTTVEKAKLESEYFDRVFSISVIEHLPESNIIAVMQNVHRCLKPKGIFVLTIDLFLNLYPFSSRRSNEFGINQNVLWLSELEKWEMVAGKSSELFGFGDFDKDNIQSNLDRYLIGRLYPTLIQCLVLRKPGR